MAVSCLGASYLIFAHCILAFRIKWLLSHWRSGKRPDPPLQQLTRFESKNMSARSSLVALRDWRAELRCFSNGNVCNVVSLVSGEKIELEPDTWLVQIYNGDVVLLKKKALCYGVLLHKAGEVPNAALFEEFKFDIYQKESGAFCLRNKEHRCSLPIS